MLVECRCYPPDFVWCLFFHISYWAAMLGCRFLVCSGFSDRYIFLHTVFICVCILNMFQAWFSVHCEDWSLSSSCLVWLLLGCRFLVCFGFSDIAIYLYVCIYIPNMFQAWFTVHRAEWSLPSSCLICLLQSSPKQLAECVDLLLQLDEPPEQLCDEFLSQWVLYLQHSPSSLCSFSKLGRHLQHSAHAEGRLSCAPCGGDL